MAELSQLAADRLLPALPVLDALGLVSNEVVQFGSRSGQETRWGNPPAADRLVLEALQRAGVRTLVLKGTLLAHTVYATPQQRVRVDTDLLVPTEQHSAAEQVFRDLGLEPVSPLSANVIDAQKAWCGEVAGARVLLDLHWHLFNNPVFADLLSFEELWQRRQEFWMGGFMASGLGSGDALLHAALHYFVHHVGQDRPALWLLDGDLLWQRMDAASREDVVKQALDLGVAGILGAFLQGAQDRFGTAIDPALLQHLHEAGKHQWRSGILHINGRPLAAQLLILRGLESKRARLNHLRRLLFPSRAWMRAKYPHARRWALPWLYARRAAEGWRRGTGGA
ncbi:MAG: nucleotidyltransferase family protein [Prochlorococcaceae cyanobacterium]